MSERGLCDACAAKCCNRGKPVAAARQCQNCLSDFYGANWRDFLCPTCGAGPWAGRNGLATHFRQLHGGPLPPHRWPLNPTKPHPGWKPIPDPPPPVDVDDLRARLQAIADDLAE